MKKFAMMFLMAMVFVFSANFVFAGDATVEGDGAAVGIDNEITNNNAANSESNSAATATGGNATATGGNADVQVSTCNVAQGGQGGQGGSVNNSGNSSLKDSGNSKNQNTVKNSVVNEDKRNHITALPGVSGAIASLAAIKPDGEWHQLLCDEYTVAELKNMKDSSSYTNRGGFYFFNLFTSPIERTVRVKRYRGTISDDTVVRLVADHPRNKIVAEYSGNGAKGAPLSSIVAYAALEGVFDTGEYSLVVSYRARDIAKLTGIGIGSGAAAALQSSNSARAGSLSVGAIIGSSEAYTQYVYDVQVKVVKASQEAFVIAQNICFPTSAPPPPAPPEVKKPEPPCPPSCDWSKFSIQIEIWREACTHCKSPCLNNAYLRSNMANAYYDWYECAGKTDKELLRKAIVEYDRAERDILNGREPDGVKTRDMEGAQVLLHKVRYNKSLAIKELYGEEAQLSYARNNGLSAVPETYAELKR